MTTGYKMGPLEWGLVALLSAIWGGSFLFAELAVETLPPFTIVLGRVVTGALALNLLVRLTGEMLPRDPKLWGAFLVMGLLNNAVPFSLIVWGQTQITGSLASILNATTPLFTVLIAHAVTKDEKLTLGKGIGVALGFAGVIAMIGPDALEELGGSLAGQIAVLLAACSYAVAGLFGRRFRGLPPLVTATGQVTSSSCLMLPLALLVDQPWALQAPSLTSVLAVVGLGLICTAFAYLIFFRILRSAGATNLALVTFLIPVSALLLGALVLGEAVTAPEILGMAMIGLGLAAIDGRPWHWLRRQKTA